MQFTRCRGILDKIIEGFVNVKNDKSKARELLGELRGSRIELVVEALGIRIDPGDTARLMEAEKGHYGWKTTQWRK